MKRRASDADVMLETMKRKAVWVLERAEGSTQDQPHQQGASVAHGEEKIVHISGLSAFSGVERRNPD